MVDHILRTLAGCFLIGLGVSQYLLFTVAFGPFTLFHAIGMVLTMFVAWLLGKAIIG